MWKLPVLLILLFSVTACNELDYYLHSVTGHLEVLSKRQTIDALLKNRTTPEKLQQQLKQIARIRDFASEQLLLPENDSYRSYVKLDRPYVVWNVVATPEFSLTPVQWRFPMVGTVSYRGYFDRKKAEAFARSFSADEYDTLIRGVPAYSTLSWFDDPALSTFSSWPAPDIAKLIFHELAHQKLYIPDDTAFNESFASSVELFGIQRWLINSKDPVMQENYQQQTVRQQQFHQLLQTTRAQLLQLYASELPTQQKRINKQPWQL